MSERLLQNTLTLFVCLVVSSVLLVIVQKVLRLLRDRHRRERRKVLEGPLMAFLCGDLAALQKLKTKRALDRELMVGFLVESAENFAGEFQARIRVVCEELGFVQSHIKRLKSWRWWVRAEAAYRLGLMGGPQAAPFLVQALDDPVPEVRLMAIRSLAALQGGLALKPILRNFKDLSSWARLEISEIVLRLGPVCVPTLLETLNGRSTRADLVAIDILGQLKDRRAVPHLVGYLGTRHKEIRIRSVKALGLIGDASALPSICRLVGDAAWEVRLMVCSAIARMGGQEHIPVLLFLLNDREKRVRVQAADALVQLGQPGSDALRKAAQDPDPFVRHLADQFLRPDATRGLLTR